MTGIILVVEDDQLQSAMICSLLTKKLNYSAEAVDDGRKALDFLQQPRAENVSLVLLDVSMPVMDGFETLRHIKTHHADLPVLMLTAQTDITTAVQAIKEGASDFIIKPINPVQLDMAIKNALKISMLTREVLRLKQDEPSVKNFADLIGHNGGLASVVKLGRKAALTNLPVYISGETGTGKELFARAVHGESKRKRGPFIAINCGAIPENIVESVLFGHEKGAFTGAHVRTLGKFREADGGTIFLDEIGELPLTTQVKLLRVLQEKEVEPVGAARSVSVNVRIISATNRDLKADVKVGRFREDLYFRLNVLPITMPSLRMRQDDIVPLAEYFMQRYALKDGLALRHLSEDAKHYLTACAWPGNVRELENLVHSTLVFFDDNVIKEQNIIDVHADNRGISGGSGDGLVLSLRNEAGRFKKLEEIENEAMQIVMKHFDDNVTRAAEALSIAKSTFYRKMKPHEVSGWAY